MSKLEKVLKEGQMAAAVAMLLKANNSVTTLEVKTQLRSEFPKGRWVQREVSAFMAELADSGDLTFKDNGTFRTYSLKGVKLKTAVKSTPTMTGKKSMKVSVTPVVSILKGQKAKKISRTNALDLMLNNKGRFFTAEFINKEGDRRVMNCQLVKDQKQAKLGYVKVREASLMRSSTPEKAIRNVNIQTLEGLKIGGVLYKVG